MLSFLSGICFLPVGSGVDVRNESVITLLQNCTSVELTSVAYKCTGMPLMSVSRSPASHQWRTQHWYATDDMHISGVQNPGYATDVGGHLSGQVRGTICGVQSAMYATDVFDICGVPKVGYATDIFPQICCHMGNTSVAYKHLVRH